jgi:hypothetical protein
MTVKEYMYTANLDSSELANLLGYKTETPILKRLDEDLPERWVRKLEELSELGVAPNPAAGSGETSDDSTEREPKISDEQINEWIGNEGRAEDQSPNINKVENSSPEVIGPQQIKIKTIEGYIQMVYGGAESICRSRGDDIAAEVIHKYTPEYTEAWIDYIKYDSRILQYLEMLQIGTPLGNLVGVHAISMGAYVLARVTAREIAAANAAAERERAEESIDPYSSF